MQSTGLILIALLGVATAIEYGTSYGYGAVSTYDSKAPHSKYGRPSYYGTLPGYYGAARPTYGAPAHYGTPAGYYSTYNTHYNTPAYYGAGPHYAESHYGSKPFVAQYANYGAYVPAYGAHYALPYPGTNTHNSLPYPGTNGYYGYFAYTPNYYGFNGNFNNLNIHH